jgi:aromatic-L-amino-acid decarboxylase
METGEFRAMGREAVDLLADYLETIESRPLFPSVEPSDIRDLFDEPLPRRGEPGSALLQEIREKLLPFCAHVNHPGYFGLMTATPTAAGIVADLIASAVNQNVGSYTIGPSATEIERRTVRWLCDLAGLGPKAGGNLTSGGTLANTIGLKLARDSVFPTAPREGVMGRWTAYVSEERHVSIDKAVDMVGVGRGALRTLPTDDAFRVRLDALEDALRRDKAAGLKPFCIIGIAGTTNTGSVDPLPELAEIARREGAWYHVDAAYGGGVLLSERYRGLIRGVERADSVTIDPHKWFFAPVDAGAVLARDESRLTASFGIRPAYLTDEMDPGGERYQYYVHGYEQSRRFRSLKVWMSFKRYGADEIARWIESNIEHARRLAELCRGSADFSCLAEPVMSAVCVRYAPDGVPEDRLAAIHRRAAREIERQGRFWISTTALKGRSAFRVNPVNFRTTLGHIEGLFETLVRECRNAEKIG